MVITAGKNSSGKVFYATSIDRTSGDILKVGTNAKEAVKLTKGNATKLVRGKASFVTAINLNKGIGNTKKVSDAELKKLIGESVKLDEAFDMKKMLKIFNKLKKNDTIKIKYDSSMRKGKDFQTFVVTSPKRTVGKKGVERVIMKHVDNPTGVKYTLYNRDGSVSLAVGDMAASMTDIQESVEHLDEMQPHGMFGGFGGQKKKSTRPSRPTRIAVDKEFAKVNRSGKMDTMAAKKHLEKKFKITDVRIEKDKNGKAHVTYFQESTRPEDNTNHRKNSQSSGNINALIRAAAEKKAAAAKKKTESVDPDEAIQRVVLGEAKAKLPMYDDALVLSPHASREVVIFNNTDPDGQSKENAWWVWQIKNALSDPAASTARRGIYDITTTKDKKFLLKDGSDSDAQKLLKKFLSKGYTEIHPLGGQKKKSTRPSRPTRAAAKKQTESVELDEADRPMQFPGKMSGGKMKGKFTSAQLKQLKDAYGKIGRINPESKAYETLTAYLDGMNKAQLKQLVDAKIPFMSSLALNRVHRAK